MTYDYKLKFKSKSFSYCLHVWTPPRHPHLADLVYIYIYIYIEREREMYINMFIICCCLSAPGRSDP